MNHRFYSTAHANLNDTIVAVSTAYGASGVGMIRLSGAQALDIAQIIVHHPLSHHGSSMKRVCFYIQDQKIDDGLILVFLNPKSFTGEDVVEFQAHGSPVILSALVQECIRLGARHADPGEFTYRAFLNKKIDLIQAEAVFDLIHAQSIAQASAASETLAGAFSKRIAPIADAIAHAWVQCEAWIDFPDEDIPMPLLKIQAIEHALSELIHQATQGHLLNQSWNVVLMGKPNVGKSSLFNEILQENRAIVTSIPGTTRDKLHGTFWCGGILMHLWDTAGLRDHTEDPIELEGMKRTYQALTEAQAVIAMTDCLDDPPFVPSDIDHQKIIYILNKTDLYHPSDLSIPQNWIGLSVKDRIGLDGLMHRLAHLYQSKQEHHSCFFSARDRHLEALKHCQNALAPLLSGDTGHCVELWAECLKCARNHLDELTGTWTCDDVLGAIFSQFCIGK